MKRLVKYLLVWILIISFGISGVYAEELKEYDNNVNDEGLDLELLNNDYNLLKQDYGSIEYHGNPEKDIQDDLSQTGYDDIKNLSIMENNNKNYRNQTLSMGEYITIYESEPNNSIAQADLLDRDVNGSSNYKVYGTITDYSFDMDYYRVDVKKAGTFDIMAYWAGKYFEFGWEDDLVFSLKDSAGNTIKWSTTYGSGTSMVQNLSAYVTPGTYYLAVMQISDYQYLYIGERYLLDVVFESSYIPVTDIELKNTKLTIDIADQEVVHPLEATVFPENATDKSVLWKSSNTGVATVSSNGKITPRSEGVTIITATTNDGGFSDVCTLSIINSESGWKIGEPQYDIEPDKTWVVEFNKTLDIRTIKEKNMYITDQQDHKFPLFFYQLSRDNEKKIYVKPLKDYESGQEYTFWIKNLNSIDGSVLNKNVKMNFTIR